MKIGVHENYQGKSPLTVATTVGRFPRFGVTREFEADVLPAQDLVKRIVARCQPAWDAGKTAVWSFKPKPADVTSGAWKPHIVKLAQHIKDKGLQHQVVIVIWHEPENDVPLHFKSPAEFVQMFNTVHDWLMAVDPTIVTSHAALGYFYRNVGIDVARRWVTKATIHSIDLYSGRSFPLEMTLGTSTGFNTWKASRPVGAPWGVSERGWIANAAMSQLRVKSIQDESDWLAALAPADRPAFYIVWNTEGVEKDSMIILDEPATAAVNTMFDRLAELSIPVPTPTPTPDPVKTQCPLCSGAGTVEPGKYVIVRVG